MSSKKFFILDASSYVFRAYHAINYLENSKGFPTNAIFGFVNMINRLFENIKPEYFAAVFDSGGKSFRNDIYDEYKAKMAEEGKVIKTTGGGFGGTGFKFDENEASYTTEKKKFQKK